MYRYNLALSNCSRYLESLKHEAPDEPTDDANTAMYPVQSDEARAIELMNEEAWMK